MLVRISGDISKTKIGMFAVCECFCVCLYIRVNLSMWVGSVKSWRLTLRFTSLKDVPLICPLSSKTMACWLRNASYSFFEEPRSDKSPFESEGSTCRLQILVEMQNLPSLSGVCRPWVSLWGSSSHWSDSRRLCVPSARLQPATLIRKQWFLWRKTHHKTGIQILELKYNWQFELNTYKF